MRLIDADALEVFVKTVRQGLYLDKTLSDIPTRDSMLLNFQQYVHLQPTISAVPVVRGEWQWYEEWKESTPDGPAECQSAGYACSVCGIGLSEYLSESLGETIYADNFEETPKIAFCPKCGAKMGGEKDES